MRALSLFNTLVPAADGTGGIRPAGAWPAVAFGFDAEAQPARTATLKQMVTARIMVFMVFISDGHCQYLVQNCNPHFQRHQPRRVQKDFILNKSRYIGSKLCQSNEPFENNILRDHRVCGGVLRVSGRQLRGPQKRPARRDGAGNLDAAGARAK
jgi:hypothetical protein